MIIDIIKKLTQLKESGDSVYFSPPCTENEIALARERSKALLGQDLPEGYVTLLLVSNGVQIDNAVIDAVGSMIDSNAELRQMNSQYLNYIVLGYEGNVDHYVFNHAKRNFQTVNFFSAQEVIESYASFDELLSSIVDTQIR